MIGSIIGGALGVAGSIFGGISASRAMKKAKKNIEAQRRKNENWYNRRYNEDATQRADAQAILKRTEESIRDRNRASAGTAAVMGGTAEAAAADKAANNKALVDATTNIAVAADQRKDEIERQYQQNDQHYQEQLNNLEVQKAQAISQAVQGVAKAGSGMASAF